MPDIWAAGDSACYDFRAAASEATSALYVARCATHMLVQSSASAPPYMIKVHADESPLIARTIQSNVQHVHLSHLHGNLDLWLSQECCAAARQQDLQDSRICKEAGSARQQDLICKTAGSARKHLNAAAPASSALHPHLRHRKRQTGPQLSLFWHQQLPCLIVSAVLIRGRQEFVLQAT